LRAITPRTRAVMAVHLYGHPCDLSPIVAICKEHNLFLVEDCAEAFGSRYQGRHVGNFGERGNVQLLRQQDHNNG
jgi:perosamine synthetase